MRFILCCWDISLRNVYSEYIIGLYLISASVTLYCDDVSLNAALQQHMLNASTSVREMCKIWERDSELLFRAKTSVRSFFLWKAACDISEIIDTPLEALLPAVLQVPSSDPLAPMKCSSRLSSQKVRFRELTRHERYKMGDPRHPSLRLDQVSQLTFHRASAATS